MFSRIPKPPPGTSLHTAATVVSRRQVCFYVACLGGVVLFMLWDYKIAFTVINSGVCGFYAVVVGYKFLCVLVSFFTGRGVQVSAKDLSRQGTDDLPVYTVLVPLYHEASVASGIIEALGRLNYPAERLDVKLLVEANDPETECACREAKLPPHFEVVIVPEGIPKTKPRACNVGLASARGEYLVIYDAEDRPEPDQLKKALLAFRDAPTDVVCLQCRLAYYNAGQNWLTRFFAVEYAAWFDLLLPGLNQLGVPIPLGGTSNHFRIDALRELGGWDPYNVTEDCDLGIRIARRGWRTLILDSTTWEEANSRLWNWMRQRSRWVKGYIQTHLTHTRRPIVLARDLGVKGTLSFLLTVGGMSAVLLLNPIYWTVAGLWLRFRWQLVYFDFTDASMARHTAWSRVSWVFFAATLALAFANVLFILINVLACWRRRQWRLMPYALLSPLYWVLISIGAWKGFLQLLTRPFYWEKTVHGLTDKEE